MKTRKLLSILIVLVMVLGLVPAMALTVLADDTAEETTPAGSEPVTIENGDYYLTVNKTQFEVGEPIMVSGSVVSQTDWIGIYNPRNGSSIKWEYVSSVGAGNEFDLREAQHVEDESLTTLPEGEYIIRLMPNNTSTLSLAKALVKIRVGNPPAISGDSTRMSLEKRVFQVGEPINVSAYDDGTTKAWVGIISAGAKQSLKYHYPSVVGEGQYYDVLQGTTLSAGAYIIALVPNNQGYEGSELIAYTTIVIVDDYNYAVENDGTEVTLLDQLTAQKERSRSRGTVNFMSAYAEKVDALRLRKRNSHKCLHRVAMNECRGTGFLDHLRGTSDVVDRTGLIVDEHKGGKADAFFCFFFDSFKVDSASLGWDAYYLESARGKHLCGI